MADAAPSGPVPRRLSRLALAAFLLALLPVPPLNTSGLVLGAVAWSRARKRPRQLRGKGLAVAAVLLGSVGNLLTAGLGLLTVIGVHRRDVALERSIARIQMKQLDQAVELYRLGAERYPTTAEGLEALLRPTQDRTPVLTSVPRDPWGAEYIYLCPGTHDVGRFDLSSAGPDGTPGTEDDVTSWEPRR